jgi:mono/diheme cytochrome c family protein
MSRIVILSVFAGFFVAGCDDKKEESKADPKVVAEAKQVWDTRCATCHGATGMGDGAGAAALKAKPRSFNNAKWQSDTDDERIKKVMVEGGAAVGLSAEMAPNPDLKDKPEVVAEIVKIVRSFGG